MRRLRLLCMAIPCCCRCHHYHYAATAPTITKAFTTFHGHYDFMDKSQFWYYCHPCLICNYDNLKLYYHYKRLYGCNFCHFYNHYIFWYYSIIPQLTLLLLPRLARTSTTANRTKCPKDETTGDLLKNIKGRRECTSVLVHKTRYCLMYWQRFETCGRTYKFTKGDRSRTYVTPFIHSYMHTYMHMQVN